MAEFKVLACNEVKYHVAILPSSQSLLKRVVIMISLLQMFELGFDKSNDGLILAI